MSGFTNKENASRLSFWKIVNKYNGLSGAIYLKLTAVCLCFGGQRLFLEESCFLQVDPVVSGAFSHPPPTAKWPMNQLL